MSPVPLSDADLQAYADGQVAPERVAAIEAALRDDPSRAASVAAVRAQNAALRDELRQFVADKIGAIARPDDVLFSADLPKTRSGKIMRRLLRDIAEGRALGDTTTLADPTVVNSLKEMYEANES